MTSLTFYVFVTVITLKSLGHTLKRQDIGEWDPPQYAAFCTISAEFRLLIFGPIVLNKRPKI